MKKKEISVERVLGATRVSSSAIIKCTKYNLKPFLENRYGGFEEQEEYATEKEKKEFRNHVNKIKESMVEFGRLLGGSEAVYDDREPILVVEINGVFYLIDGQNRYAAAKELGIPYYIMIIQSTLTDKKGKSLSSDLDYVKNLFNRLNNNKVLGGSVKWSTDNKISAAARGGNEVARYICKLCEKNPLIKVASLNYAVRDNNVKIKGKQGNGSTVSAYEMVDFYKKIGIKIKEKDIIKRIDNFMDVSMKIVECSYTDFPFKNENNKKVKYRAMMNQKVFTSAVGYVLDKKLPLEIVYMNAKYKHSGIISRPSISDYLKCWGVSE